MRCSCRLCAVAPRACVVHALAARPSIPQWTLSARWLRPAPPTMAIEEKEDEEEEEEEEEEEDDDDAADEQTQKQDEYRVKKHEPIDIDADDDDLTLAEKLQIQECLLFSTQLTSNNSTNSISTSKPSSSRSRSICRICSDTGCMHSVSIECTSDHGAEAAFRVAITGEFNREALLKLANTLNDAADRLPTGEKGKGKGKEKLQFGESSWLPIELEEDEEEEEEAKFYCGICMEYLPIAEWFGVEDCSHIFCAGCVGSYVAAKVEENLIPVKCPEPNCRKGVLEPDMCRRIIPREVFDRWGLALAESAVGAEKFYCPYKDCSRLLIHDGGGDSDGDGDGSNAGEITDAECPHCRRIFCAQCRVPWHDGIWCEDFQKLGKDERGREDLMLRKLAADKRWQRCPQCKMYVEKDQGCMAITCRCGYCFCYSCGSQLSKSNHYCFKCDR